MKIVIDISAEDFEAYKMQVKTIEQEGLYYESSNYELKRLIANGTPLPKGHGRLIDADQAKETMMYEMCGTGYQGMAMNVLNSEFYTPTIIEADKAESEEV